MLFTSYLDVMSLTENYSGHKTKDVSSLRVSRTFSGPDLNPIRQCLVINNVGALT